MHQAQWGRGLGMEGQGSSTELGDGALALRELNGLSFQQQMLIRHLLCVQLSAGLQRQTQCHFCPQGVTD